MGENKKCRREMLALQAVEPGMGKLMTVYVSHRRLMALKKRTKGQILEAGELLPYVIQKPRAIFEGLCRNADEPKMRGYGWLCYSGRPPHAYTEDGKKIPPRRDQVFLAFLTDEKVLYLWYWYKCHPVETDLPIDYEERFKERRL
ncbi:hypothetical protein ACFL5Z_04785 [Planctomycetota bacterium]